MAILVTGGAGYIGSHTVRALSERGERIVVLDSLTSGRPAAVPAGIPLIVADVRDGARVREALIEHDVDTVVHLAAAKSVAGSIAAPGATFSVNHTGTLALLEAMREARVGRLVFSSTCAIYGTPDHLPIAEDAALRPENPYGESKAQAERVIEWYGRLAGLRWLSLRYFNAAGAHASGEIGEDWDHAENLIPKVLRAAWSGGAVPLHGTDYPTPDGTAVRDYIHVDDLADAHLRAIDAVRGRGEGGFRSEPLNLGRGAGTSVREVVAVAEEVTGRAISLVPSPRREGDPAAVWADPRRAEAVLGWKARHDLHSMISSAWRWHERGEHERSGRDPAAELARVGG